MRRPGRALLALASLLLTGAALAEDESRSRDYIFHVSNPTSLLDKGVIVSTRDVVLAPNYGYAPLRVALENATGERQVVRLRFTPSGSRHTSMRDVELAPRERQHVVLPIAVSAGAGRVRAEVSPLGSSGSLPVYLDSNSDRSLLFVGTQREFEDLVGEPPSTSVATIGVFPWEPVELPEDLSALIGFDVIAVSTRFAELRDGLRHQLAGEQTPN